MVIFPKLPKTISPKIKNIIKSRISKKKTTSGNIKVKFLNAKTKNQMS